MSAKKQQSQVTQMTAQVHFCKAIPKETTLSELRIRLDKVNKLYDEFETNQNALDELVGSDLAAQNNAVRQQIDDFYFLCAATLQEAITGLTKLQEQHERQQQSRGGNERHQQEVKLPKIEIPLFSGNYEDWTSFRDFFNSLIHTNKTIGNVQKLQYLKGALDPDGEAHALIKLIPVTDANYAEAWRKLTSRYDHKRYIVDSLLKSFFSQPKISKENHNDIKKLIDRSSEIVQSLQLQGVRVDHWDCIIVHVIVSKLDCETHKHWELLQKKNELPKFKDLQSFLEGRWQSLEMVYEDSSFNADEKSDRDAHTAAKFVSSSNVSSNQLAAKCHYCKDTGHKVSQCSNYVSLSVSEKKEFMKKNRLCFNCMAVGHSTSDCSSISRCRTCNGKHHSSIHIEYSASYSAGERQQSSSNNENVKNSAVGTSENPKKRVLLATATVYIHSATGDKFPVKALIDKGSEAAMISEKLAAKLNLLRKADNSAIKGLGDVPVETSNEIVSFQISSHIDPSFVIDIPEATTMKKITGDLPVVPVLRKEWPHLQGIKLADMHFDRPSSIDILLGAEAFEQIIMDGIIQKRDDSPTAMNSRLGWLLFGVVKGGPQASHNFVVRKCLVAHKSQQLEGLLQKFWETEEIQEIRKLTNKEQLAEQIFTNSVHKDINGRYEVALPFDPDKETLRIGESRKAALSNLFRMEQRFKSNHVFNERYKSYFKNLIDSGHIELVPSDKLQLENHQKYYLPHHAVLKEESLTTKLRVVFDASRKSSTGISLNDILLVGPKVQDDLFSILIRWRKHRIAFIADVEKMFRQVKIVSEHRDFQRLLWRFDQNDPIMEYRITTVIDGTASASYLAARVLQQLAEDGAVEFPEAAKIVKQDFYVDDMSSGAPNVEKAKSLQNELIKILSKGGMVLTKWFSNSKEILENVPAENRRDQSALVEIVENSVKTLGVYWNQIDDSFQFKIAEFSTKDRLTKREMLSEISRIFDPIGWLAPSTITAKILMQSLWQVKDLDWDDKVPKDKMEVWRTYRDQLHLLEQIKIPRWIGTGEIVQIQLHAFGDASVSAYAAVVYSRIVHSDGSIIVNLISAKTKVAPIKVLSIPKLELCGSVLVAKLVSKVRESFKFQDVEVLNYCDNTTVLAWLKSQPNQYNVFVANRITEVQNLTNEKNWFFVATEENPADVASRGILPSQLKDHELWWTGPKWLAKNQSEWPHHQTEFETDEEKRKTPINAFVVRKLEDDYLVGVLEKHSVLAKLLRNSARMVQFCKNRIDKTSRKLGPNALDLRRSLKGWIRHIQSLEFQDDVVRCKAGDKLGSRSRLKQLQPFLDEDGILRVGGRIRNSILPFRTKHPIILPKNSHLTKLIIEEAHKYTIHGGPTLMSAFLSNYWIFGKAKRIKQVCHSCVTCFTYRCKPQEQVMANLPDYRVTQQRAFLHTGVDFAGPLLTKAYTGRSRGKHANPTKKSYIAIFVCMVTKGIHIELVSDMTAVAFVASLKRFVARRGKCSDMYSDNGKNFVGGNKELKEEFKALMEDPELQEYLARDGIVWHFNPPLSPHFGGLWEVGVKSIKHHLKRLVGNNTFTFEEMATILCQIEACLNSRPICQLSDDVNDVSYLTPGHFLIGEAPITIPEISLLNQNVNRLSRWKLLQHTYQLFWKYWSSEYLQSLQKRPKWIQANENVKVGQIALLREDNVPPGKWPLAKIIKVFPGEDGKVRVVKLQKNVVSIKQPIPKDLKGYLEKIETRKSFLRRNISQISVLPIEDNE